MNLRFPIGPAVLPAMPLTGPERVAFINQLAALPGELAAVVEQLGPARLAHPYRPGGWTGQQLVHHVADVHLRFYVRFHLALTEEHPTIQGFDQNAWATLPDVAATPVDVSLALLAALHARWVTLLRHLTEAQWSRTFFHAGYQRLLTLEQALVLYNWHGQHHLAHLKLLLGA